MSLAGVLLAVFGATPPLRATAFTFGDFSSPAGLTLVGDAALTANRLRLTGAAENQVGGAWLSSRANVQNGFTTTFQFQITDCGGYKPDWTQAARPVAIARSSWAEYSAGWGSLPESSRSSSLSKDQPPKLVSYLSRASGGAGLNDL